tara:strand:- start:73669 stop:73974 length:306 start_codon:yes stop_codon:yes gene_type:complete
VLAFPGEAMTDDDLEQFSSYFGHFGDDPFIEPIPGREHIIAVERQSDEKAPLFADQHKALRVMPAYCIEQLSPTGVESFRRLTLISGAHSPIPISEYLERS